MAVPSVGRGVPVTSTAGHGRMSGDIWTCREAVQHRTRGDIYILPVPCAGVRQWTVVTVHLSISLYIHTYIYIYIYTQVLVDAPGHEIYCSETAVHPPAAGPRVTRPDVPLSRRGAPLGVDAGPGPTANWSIPRLAPSMVTAPGNAPRAPWPTANWRVSPATVARAPAPLPSPLLVRPPPRSTPILPISLGQLAHPRTPSIPSIPPSPSARGSRPPWPTAPAPTPTPARSGLLYGGPGPPGACADAVAACNGPRPAASPSSYGPRRVAP